MREQHRECDSEDVRGHHRKTVSFTVRVWGASQRQCDGEGVREQHRVMVRV